MQNFKINNFIMRAWIIIPCLFILNVHAKIIKDDVLLVDKKVFSFREVCKELTHRESPLISFHSITKLDCMGTVVEVGKFCDQKTQDDPYYIRAVVSKKDKQVFCKSAKRVQLKYLCESSKDRLCEDKEIGCYLLQEKLAKRLKVVHSSLISKENKKYLNCHFLPKRDDLNISSDKI